jgi:hypothetical protein
MGPETGLPSKIDRPLSPWDLARPPEGKSQETIH